MWARTWVTVKTQADDGDVILDIDDDGRGLTAEQRKTVLHSGERLDESVQGFGFGLSITRELAELYGGRISFDVSNLGGLRATLRRPAVIAPPGAL